MSDDDLPFVAEVYASTRREEVDQTGCTPEAREEFLRHQHAAQHHHYSIHHADADWLIIERDGEDIGRLYLRENEDALHIIDIALLPDARRHGVGGAILHDIFDRARELSKGVTIHVEKFNPARTLYHRLGFEVAGDAGIYDFMRATP